VAAAAGATDHLPAAVGAAAVIPGFSEAARRSSSLPAAVAAAVRVTHPVIREGKVVGPPVDTAAGTTVLLAPRARAAAVVPVPKMAGPETAVTAEGVPAEDMEDQGVRTEEAPAVPVPIMI
jgi:hypothetical protein